MAGYLTMYMCVCVCACVCVCVFYSQNHDVKPEIAPFTKMEGGGICME